MRALIRLLVTVGLVSGAASLAPLATASADQTPSAAPDTTATSTASPTDPSPSSTPSTSASESASESPSGSASESATPSESPSESPSGSTAPSMAATPGATHLDTGRQSSAATVPHVTFTHRPPNLGLTKKASFSYRSDVSGVSFQCRLTTGAGTATWGSCPADAGGSTGTRTYLHLKGNAQIYHFQVRAVLGGHAGPVASDPFRIWNVWAPGSFVPHTGASFNHVLGSRAHQRTNLTRVIKTINSMPGYRQASPSTCPGPGPLNPGTIRISLYSLTDQAVAHALTAANHRCISVQVLMNDHLNAANDPAWRHLAGTLGTNVRNASGQIRHSFAHRCHRACRGGGVLHLKMYLFNSTVPAPKTAANKILRTVLTGSSNMTSNAAKVQWNDLYGVRNDPQLFGQFSHHFNLMRLDNGFHRNPATYSADGGRYTTSFAPGPKGYDPYKSALSAVHCSGATGGSGINGHTVLYINMHAWFGNRGNALASRVRHLYNSGCYVRVLYSFMGYKNVYKKLISGASSRMVVRRTQFSRNGRTAAYYSHMKSLAISGHVGSNTAARLAYTGSNNWTDQGINFDEVVLRISGVSAYQSYRNHWIYIRNHHSSGTYANYSEPSGGGRAP